MLDPARIVGAWGAGETTCNEAKAFGEGMPNSDIKIRSNTVTAMETNGPMRMSIFSLNSRTLYKARLGKISILRRKIHHSARIRPETMSKPLPGSYRRPKSSFSRPAEDGALK